jgi:adenylate cyclase
MSRARRLAAIMFTDIQGYTKLMQEDEDIAIQIRNRHREVFDSATSKNNGEIIQYYGDGTLSVFDSCVDAVRCAKEMQDQFQSDPVIPVRIGVHLGDIVLSGEEIIGDSVNVASRVESLGVPGSVLISQKVFEEVRNKQEFEFRHLGAFHFKNDKKPRNIYALSGGKLMVPKKRELQGKLETSKRAKRIKRIYQVLGSLVALLVILWGAGVDLPFIKNTIKSLAVLPLYDRIGLESDEAYIIEGLHEEIITKLSKVGLNVKPYSTMRHYRDNPKTPEEIGNELHVDGLVEGSLFRAEDIYRIRVQIIEVANQEYVMDPYEAQAAFSGILSIYADLVEAIAEQIKHTLSDEAKSYLRQNQKIDPEAYDLYLRGRYYLNIGSYEDILTAIDFYNKSLVIDSTFGDAHVALIESYLLLGFTSNNPSNELDRFRYHLGMAVEKDPFFARDPHLIAMVKIFDNWDWLGAAEEVKKAIKASPRTWEPYDTYCQLMWAMGDMDQSIEAGEKAVKMDPDAHYAHCDLAWAYYFDRQYENAKQELDKTIQMFGTDCPHHSGLALIMDIDSKLEIGQSLVTTINRIEREIDRTEYNPVYNLSILGYAHALEGNREKALEILDEVESRNLPGTAKIYIALGDYDKAFDILDASITNLSFYQMYVIKQAPWYDPLRDDPRFDRILTRMGLSDQQLK